MIVLGIHDGHCASACLMVDGVLVALAAEERFTRQKNDYGYPRQAIDYCLAAGGVSPEQITFVAFASNNINALHVKLKSIATFQNEDWIKLHKDYWKPLLTEGREDRTAFRNLLTDPRFKDLPHWYDLSWVDENYDPKRDAEKTRAMRLEGLKRHLGISGERVGFFDHHSCHAYYALYGSHIRQPGTMVYTLDGGGDATVCTIWRFEEDGSLSELGRSNGVDVARIYRETTLLMGMKMGEHEFKVMGLAPYATDRELNKSRQVFDGMFTLDGDMIAYAQGRKPSDLYFWFRDAFEGHRFDGIAAALQDMAENVVCDWIVTTCRRYGAKTAVFAGGVAMNVKLNMLLAEDTDLADFYVPPSPSDDTLCVGACYMAELDADAKSFTRLAPVDNPYLGPDVAADDIARALASARTMTDVSILENAGPDVVGGMIADGKVVARCSGRMEFGQRALGNRSILGDPRKPETVEKINHQIKYRDFWMPFAPVIKAERANDYLDVTNKEIRRPYMMIGARTTEAGRTAIEGALHRGDQTARPQVLRREQNPDYYDTITAFEQRTGVGALLNTSFNLHGEPIVLTAEDALSTFARSGLDGVLMGNVLVSRK